MSELITLQFGPHSNAVGAHWWHLEAAALAAKAATSGELADHACFTPANARGLRHPRLVLCGRRQELLQRAAGGGEAGEAAADGAVPAGLAWQGGATTVHQQTQPEPVAEDLPGENGACATAERGWAEWLQTPLHLKSTCSAFSQGEPDDFSQGVAERDVLEELEDRFRYFAEGCDRLQGIQAWLDADSAFAGLGTGLLTVLRDEYSKTPLLATSLAMSPPLVGKKTASSSSLTHAQVVANARRQVNAALCLEHLSSLSTLCLPLYVAPSPAALAALPRLALPPEMPAFFTGAVLSSALHTALCPARLSNGRADLASMCRELLPYPKLNVCALELAMPLEAHVPALDVCFRARLAGLARSAQSNQEPRPECETASWLAPLGPFLPAEGKEHEVRLAEQRVVRGTALLHKTWPTRTRAADGARFPPQSLQETFAFNMGQTSCLRRNNVFLAQPMAVPRAFPQRLFRGAKEEKEVAVMTHIRSFRSQHISLQANADQFVLASRQLQAVAPEALSADDMREAHNGLKALASEYESLK
eukprot:g46507.t1